MGNPLSICVAFYSLLFMKYFHMNTTLVVHRISTECSTTLVMFSIYIGTSWGSRFPMRGSAQIPHKQPVLRPLSTDTSTLRQVVKQPRTLIGTANPGMVPRLHVVTLPLDDDIKGGLCPRCILVLTYLIRCSQAELQSMLWLMCRANR